MEQRQLTLEELMGKPEVKIKQPAQNTNLTTLIMAEHQCAELERLRAGYDGCGCADCQSFYHTINLSEYGDRVKEYDSAIVIVAGRTGATKWEQYHREECWKEEVFTADGKGYGANEYGDSVCMGNIAGIPAKFLIEDSENDGAKPNIQRPGAFRSRTNGKTEHRTAHIKPAAFRKRVPGDKVKC